MNYTPGPWEYNKDSRWPNCLMAPNGCPGALSMVRVAHIKYVNAEDAKLLESSPTMHEQLRLVAIELAAWLELPSHLMPAANVHNEIRDRLLAVNAVLKQVEEL